jgi:hypothetical protein
MMNRNANYIETVGLILIGFAIQQMIFGRAPFGEFGIAWGLVNSFNGSRFIFLLIECALIVGSLLILQSRRVELPKPPFAKSSISGVRWVLRSLWSPNSKRVALAVVFQLISVVSTWQIVGIDSAACLGIGFLFIDISLNLSFEAERASSITSIMERFGR